MANATVTTVRMRPRGCPNRRAAALVELAIVLPFLLLLVFGIIEFGQVAYVRHVLINAATQGAREATLPGSTAASVDVVVQRVLADASVDGYPITVEYTSESLPSLAETVSLSVPYSEVGLLGIFDNFALTSTCTMFRGPLD